MPVDLNDVTFRWQALHEAASCQVTFLSTDESPSPTTHDFHTVSVPEPSLRLSDLPHADQERLRRELIAGRTGGWRIEAFDEDNRRIGLTRGERRFLVAEPLATSR